MSAQGSTWYKKNYFFCPKPYPSLMEKACKKCELLANFKSQQLTIFAHLFPQAGGGQFIFYCATNYGEFHIFTTLSNSPNALPDLYKMMPYCATFFRSVFIVRQLPSIVFVASAKTAFLEGN